MKKLLAMLLALSMCLASAWAFAEETTAPAVGDSLIFGAYEQDNDTTNGKEPIEWFVVDVQEDKMLVMSKYGLDARAFHTAFVRMTWGKCEMRQWLNSTFLNDAFSQEEQLRIVEVTNENPDNSHYGTPGGKATVDKIFFLTLYEAEKYFPKTTDRTCQPTPYAVARGAYINETTGNCWWFLRTPGVRPVDVCGVRADGRISGYGSRDVNRPSGSVRPVMWLTIQK